MFILLQKPPTPKQHTNSGTSIPLCYSRVDKEHIFKGCSNPRPIPVSGSSPRQ